MLKRLILVLLMATPTMAQTSFYTDRALQQVNVLTSPTPLTAAIPYGSVRVCGLPLTQQSPCLPLATITDVTGNPISNSIGTNFGQFLTDATGRFTFGCTLGLNYQVQVTQSASNTPFLNFPITCPGVGSNPQFGNLTLNGPGVTTFNAGITSAGPNTLNGNLTAGGTVITKQVNGSSVVDATCATNWGNADLGACINAAYAAGPSSGVDILVSPTPNANGSGCTNFTTSIVFNTLHKPAYLHGPPGQIVCLNYTPLTGTIVTFDYGNTLTSSAGLGPGYGHGMFGIMLNGPSAGGSVVGLAIGATNGSEGLSFESGGIMNVGTAITFGGGTNFFQKFKQFVIGPTNLAFNLNVAIENVSFVNTKFECSFSGPTSACIQFTTPSGLSDVNFTNSSFDDSNVSVNSACGPTCVRVNFNECHFEVTASSTQDIINVQGGTVSAHQSLFKYGPALGGPPSELITCNTGNCSMSLDGNSYDAGQTITQAIRLTGGGQLVDTGDVFFSPNFSNRMTDDGNVSEGFIFCPAIGSQNCTIHTSGAFTTVKQLGTTTNCSNNASPAVCGASVNGSVAIAAAASTLTVNTTAVTANSQILLTRDDSLGTKLSVTCNTATVMGEMKVSARTAGTSFTITVQTAPVTNPGCVSYTIMN